MLVRGVIVAAALAGCVDSTSHRCGDAVCPAGTTCAAYRDLMLCVSPAQLTACAGVADGEACTAAFEGTCHDGVCLPIGCGNGRIDDPIYGTGEQCDDGGRLGHDGCSSTCQDEVPGWAPVVFEDVEPASEFAAAVDTSRGSMMVFGGLNYGAVPSTLVYEHDDTTWVARFRPPVAPSQRQGTSLANDGHRRRLVLFGGIDDLSYRADTWEWNGTVWQPQPLAAAPPPRAYHGLAYDPVRRVTVLFGGRNDSGELGDTWEWDGERWVERTLSPSPSPRADHVLVYDPARGVVVMIGEVAPGVVETWEYDGAWRDVTTAVRPAAAMGAAVAYDGVARRLVLLADDGAGASTWTFDGAWTPAPTALAPPGPYGAAAATGPIDGRVLVYGGRRKIDPFTASGEWWRWDGEAWSEEPTSARRFVLPARAEHAAVLDVHRGRVVVFGGALAAVFGDTWELASDGWYDRTPASGPSPRSAHTMVYDAARRVTVLFGGTPADPATWTWDGVSWTSNSGSPGPATLTKSAAAYDAARGRVVAFGGAATSSVVATTWLWDGSAWTTLAPAGPTPPARAGAAMAYDPIRREVILFGGSMGLMTLHPSFNDTWAWNGSAWRKLDPVQVPPARTKHALVWDPARQRLVMWGGIAAQSFDSVWEWDGSNWSLLSTASPSQRIQTVAVPGPDGAGVLDLSDNESARNMQLVFSLRWSAPTAYEACAAGDHDGDGLQGCADPDCWAQCTPECPPGVSPCTSSAGCGDGTCSALETCHACAIDCGACPVVCGDFVCAPGEDCAGDCADGG